MISAVFRFCARRPDRLRSRTHRAIADKLGERIENRGHACLIRSAAAGGLTKRPCLTGSTKRSPDGCSLGGPKIEEVRGIAREKQPKGIAVWFGPGARVPEVDLWASARIPQDSRNEMQTLSTHRGPQEDRQVDCRMQQWVVWNPAPHAAGRDLQPVEGLNPESWSFCRSFRGQPFPIDRKRRPSRGARPERLPSRPRPGRTAEPAQPAQQTPNQTP
ncbi:hypothetical protein R69658_06562 [Paraburkholderia aspalathi]|uniref:Uncharacterized protein n=1 Tax=Paraburkholderia aspalathi TaxID=1324617 RepID=A0ABM8SWG3_9BURK|nr:hypothetical protein R69658_06562 [Paraburkholderia aspalathi]